MNIIMSVSMASSGVRKVSGSSCDRMRVNLGLGMTTQIIFEQEPKVTLFADKKHFKVKTNKVAHRSLAIIPFFESSELDVFRDSRSRLPSPKVLASILDKNFKTNLFVFFENNNQLMFELRFVPKEKADSILKVTQVFSKDCNL